MVTGRDRDVLGVAAGRPRRGKWRTGRRERRSLRSRSELEPPEVNTTPASRAEWGALGISLRSPGGGRSVGWEWGGFEAQPTRCWAQTRPGHTRCGPLGSWPTSPLCWEIVGHCSLPPARSGGRGSEEKGDGHQKRRVELGVGPRTATATLKTHITSKTRTYSGSYWAVAPGRISNSAGLSVTQELVCCFLFAGEMDDPGLCSFILKPNTHLVRGWVKAV